MKGLIRVVFELVLIAGIFFLAYEVIKRNKQIEKLDASIVQQNEALAGLKSTNEDYEKSIINLRKLINTLEENYFSDGDFIQLNVTSKEQAKEVLWNSILKQEDKIQAHPVLGGRFYFTSGAPIKNNYYIAQIEDGHILGSSLYKYNVTKNGIIWKHLDTTFE